MMPIPRSVARSARAYAVSEDRWAVEEFTTHHWISVQHMPRDYAI